MTNASDPKSTASASARLHPTMSAADIDAGYYYAAELKVFTRELGLTVGNFRKIELEGLIREFLTTGVLPKRRPVMPRKAGAERDTLTADTRVVNYVGDKKTKAFLLELVLASVPSLGDKSGQWYWLKDWRGKKQEQQARFTYQDIADHLRRLRQTKGRLPQIPSAQMNNFITDFNANPANSSTGRDAAKQAWMWLKSQPGPNTYADYCKIKSAQQAIAETLIENTGLPRR